MSLRQDSIQNVKLDLCLLFVFPVFLLVIYLLFSLFSTNEKLLTSFDLKWKCIFKRNITWWFGRDLNLKQCLFCLKARTSLTDRFRTSIVTKPTNFSYNILTHNVRLDYEEMEKRETKKSGYKGRHGYDNELHTMNAFFVATGFSSQSGETMKKPFDQVNIFPSLVIFWVWLVLQTMIFLLHSIPSWDRSKCKVWNIMSLETLYGSFPFY